MIKSMTGYGGAKGVSGKIEVSIELRSVNNRYLDVGIKIPRMYIAVEERIKSTIAKYISRGKVDVFVMLDSKEADDVAIMIDKALAEGYLRALRELSADCGVECTVTALDLAKFPDVLCAKKTEPDVEALFDEICSVLETALDGFEMMRRAEGEKLYADLSERLSTIQSISEQIEERSKISVEEYRKKLETRLVAILQDTSIEESRILTECAIFADRTAINEELVRLRSHIEQLGAMLKSGGAVGRKLDFLVQEFNREVNTIGSKGNDAQMAKLVIDLKSEIEKIREQAQNIE